MKKLKFNSTLNHKQSDYKTREVIVEKVITLYGKSFSELKDHPLRDDPHIAENRDLMYIDDNDAAHCLLMVDYDSGDGILVESEGMSYARKFQFIPNARALVENSELIPFADSVKKLAESLGIYTLEELEQKKVFRFWDRLMLLCEFYRISADNVLKEYENKLSKEYILSLKYSKTVPNTAWLENKLCHKFGIEKEFWNADTDNIMSYLVSRKERSSNIG